MRKKAWAALLAAAMCLSLLAGCGSSGTDAGAGAVIYLTAENELQLKKNIPADGEAIKLTDRAADPEVYREYSSYLPDQFNLETRVGGRLEGPLVWQSKDGAALYFLARVGYDTATLYRADIGQMKPGSDKNDTCIEKLDGGVFTNSVRQAADGLLYEKSGDSGRRLYYYNGRESIKLIDGGWEESRLTDGETGLLYMTRNQVDGTRTLYYQPLTEDGEREKLAAGITSFYYTNGVLLYTKYRDGAYDIYTGGPGQESTKLVSGAGSTLSAWGKSFYYEVISHQELPLSQFVDDPNAPADIPSGTAPSPRDPSPEDFRLDVYRSTVEEFERASGVSYVEWCENRLEMNAETEELFKEEMDRRYGPLYDTEAYEAERAEYEEWLRREEYDSLRRQLRNRSVTVSQTQLYFFNGTESALICDDVSTVIYRDAASQTALYSKNQRGAVTEKLSISDIYDANQVEDWYYEQAQVTSESGLWYYTIGAAAEGELEMDGDFYVLGLLNGGKELLLKLSDNSEVVSLPVTDGVLGKSVSIAEDVYTYQVSQDQSAVYYYENVSDGTGDLRRYQNGVSEALATDVSCSDYVPSNCVYSDGVTLGLRDLGSSGGTLTRFEKGESTRVADDVTYYLRLSAQNILYLSDGNLYAYDGKEKQRLASDACLMWSTAAMDGVAV